MIIRARGIQSVLSPWIRCATTSRGVQVSGPSSTRVHPSGSSPRSVVSTAGVRSRTGIASSRTKSIPEDTPCRRYQLLFPSRKVQLSGARMTARSFAVLAPLAFLSLGSSPAAAQAPERAIRRDIPMTNTIRRAHAAGTRDSTGRPGRNYWQLWTDYKITARLDTVTSIISGREIVTFRNNSDTPMTSVVLRLDQNIFRPDAGRVGGVGLLTDGMKISRLVVNGQALNVTDTVSAPIPNSSRRTTPLARLLRQTSARIPLATPIAPHTSATLEADWSFEVPRVEGSRGFRMGRFADSLYQVAQWYPRIA